MFTLIILAVQRRPLFDCLHFIVDFGVLNQESSILEYLTGVLGGQLHQLWKLSPALAAAAIPSWYSNDCSL